MTMERLDFEQPIVELEEQLNKAIQLGEDNNADVTKIVSDIKKKLSCNVRIFKRKYSISLS